VTDLEVRSGATTSDVAQDALLLGVNGWLCASWWF
jgi:hypothetical protein